MEVNLNIKLDESDIKAILEVAIDYSKRFEKEFGDKPPIDEFPDKFEAAQK